MLGDSAEGGTVQRWLCARREGSRALPRAKPRTGALFAAAQGGYAARGGGAGVASHPESTSGAGGGGGGTLDGGATGFAICAATGAATGWCSAGTCGADTAALGAGSATGASSSGQSQRSSRSSLPTATGVPGKASGTSPRFRPARPVESRAPAAFSVPSSCSLLARVETSVERSLDRDWGPCPDCFPTRRVCRGARRAPRVDGFSTSAQTSATCSTLARTHGGSSLLCSWTSSISQSIPEPRGPLLTNVPLTRTYPPTRYEVVSRRTFGARPRPPSQLPKCSRTAYSSTPARACSFETKSQLSAPK